MNRLVHGFKHLSYDERLAERWWTWTYVHFSPLVVIWHARTYQPIYVIICNHVLFSFQSPLRDFGRIAGTSLMPQLFLSVHCLRDDGFGSSYCVISQCCWWSILRHSHFSLNSVSALWELRDSYIQCSHTASEMTYIVSGGALNSTHSLSDCTGIDCWTRPFNHITPALTTRVVQCKLCLLMHSDSAGIVQWTRRQLPIYQYIPLAFSSTYSTHTFSIPSPNSPSEPFPFPVSQLGIFFLYICNNLLRLLVLNNNSNLTV